MHLACVLVLGLAAVIACRPDLSAVESGPPAPFVAVPDLPAPVESPPVPAEALELNLPALEPDPSLQFAGDPMYPTRGHRLPDGRIFIHDSHRERIAILDPATGHRTELGEAVLRRVPRLGWLVVPKDGPIRHCDVAPGRGLRVLWESREGEGVLAGLDRGAPLLVFPAAAGLRLVRLRGPGAAEIRTFELPPGMHVPSADAIRGRRMLLVGADGRSRLSREANERGRLAPFSAGVFVLDLDTGALRSLGDARGAWTLATAMSHPYVALRWSDHDPHAQDHGWAEDCINEVDVATGALRACTDPASLRTSRSP